VTPRAMSATLSSNGATFASSGRTLAPGLLASGVLVVSTNVGGVPYLVEDGKTALLVPPQDPDAMAQCVLRLVEDRALAARLRAAGKSYVEQYSWSSVRPRLLDAYRNALGERP